MIELYRWSLRVQKCRKTCARALKWSKPYTMTNHRESRSPYNRSTLSAEAVWESRKNAISVKFETSPTFERLQLFFIKIESTVTDVAKAVEVFRHSYPSKDYVRFFWAFTQICCFVCSKLFLLPIWSFICPANGRTFKRTFQLVKQKLQCTNRDWGPCVAWSLE